MSGTSENAHAELARRLHVAITSADLATIRQLMSPDVIWHVGGHGQLAADHEGIDPVIGMFGRLYDMTEGTLSYDVHDVLANDEHAVVLLTVRATIAGRDLADRAVHVCHVHDDHISEVWSRLWEQRGFDDAMTELVTRGGR